MSIAVVFGILFSIVCGILAADRHRHRGAWAVLGFLFGLGALIVLIWLPRGAAPMQTLVGIGFPRVR